MSAVAAHTFQVYAKSTAGAAAGDELDGINDVSISSSKTMLETTDFKDTTGARTRMAGLEDASISLSGDYESADAPQLLLRSSFDSGATVYVTILVDPSASAGSQGYRFPCIVESYESKGSVDGKAEFSVSLVMNGAKVAV